jgi:hypothetical protein
VVKVNGQPVQVMSYRDGNWWATVVAATVPQGGSALVEMYAEGLVPDGTDRIDVFTGVNVSRGMLDCASAKVPSVPALRHRRVRSKRRACGYNDWRGLRVEPRTWRS